MKKWPFSAAALALTVALVSGCSGNAGETVSVQSVGMICGVGSTATIERFAGVVETKTETKIEKDQAFTVADILVEVGDVVQEGQTLFVYDKDRMALELEKAELELQLDKSTVSEKKANIEQLKKERDKAGASSKLGYTLQIQQLEVEITESEFAIASKEKELEAQRKLLDNLEVTAPVSGSIRSINTTGQTDNYGNQLPFMVITELGDYRVKGYVNEANRASLYEGMEVLVRSRVDATVQKGTIKTIDLTNPQQSGGNVYYYDTGMGDDTQTSNKYPFYVELSSSAGFILGQHVYIEPDYGQADSTLPELFLPEYYINDADTDPWVWAESSRGKLEKRSVTLGEYDPLQGIYPVLAGLTADDYVAFPEEGLKAGMTCTEYDGYEDMPLPGPSMDGTEPYIERGVMLEDGSFLMEDGTMAIPAVAGDEGDVLEEDAIVAEGAEGAEGAEVDGGAEAPAVEPSAAPSPSPAPAPAAGKIVG